MQYKNTGCFSHKLLAAMFVPSFAVKLASAIVLNGGNAILPGTDDVQNRSLAEEGRGCCKDIWKSLDVTE